MSRRGDLPLIASLIVFIIFFSNVSLGAAGIGVFLGDKTEMLTLLLASALFVIGVLGREGGARD